MTWLMGNVGVNLLCNASRKKLFKWFWMGSKWHFHVLWPSALHVCELMFSLSLFRGLHLSCHLLLFCFYFDHHMVAPCPFYFFPLPSFFFLSFFLLSFCFSVSQCGVPGWVLWSYRTVCKYDTSCLLVFTSSLSFSLSECFTVWKL